jgi:hypothetical protein
MIEQARIEAMELPVARLLRRISDPNLPEQYKDHLSIAVAPYVSPRMTALAVLTRPSQWTDQQLQQILDLLQEDLTRLGIDRDKYPYEVTNAQH